MKRFCFLLMVLSITVVRATPSLPSGQVAHPVLSKPEEQLNLAPIPADTAVRLKQEFQRAATQPMPELLSEVSKAAAQNRYLNHRAGNFEDIANLFAYYAGLDHQNSDYAERALRIMETVARKNQSRSEIALAFADPGRAISPTVYAYDRHYDSPAWQKLPPDSREIIEKWFTRTSYVLLRQLGVTTDLHNMMPHAIQSGSGTALVLNSPELIREWMRFTDRLITRNQILEDGIYCDFSTSYQQQVTNHLRWAMFNFGQFRDPPGYQELTDGVSFDGAPAFPLRRWPLYDQMMIAVDAMRLPDGRNLPLGDTHCPPKPEKQEPSGSAKNLEFNIYGLFSLCHGSGDGLRQTYLSFAPLIFGMPYAGGHQHMDNLSIQLWGENSDQVPDAGYAAYRDGFSSFDKYFFHSARYHNTAMVWDRKAEPYELQSGNRTRARLIGYEDGSGSERLLQYIEAAAPGPEFNGVKERRRLLLQIPSGDNHSYTVDIFRLAGGEIHESYLLQSENEACDLKLSAIPESHTGTLRDLFGKQGGEGYNQYLDFFRDIRTIDGAVPLDGEFIGKNSGVRTRFFLNPLNGGLNCFSTAPNLRRYKFEPLLPGGARRYKFGELRGHHLTRHVPVSGSAATIFGAVYEIVGAKAAPAITKVEWFRDGDAVAVTIHTAQGSDTIYSSPDNRSRKVGAVEFAGYLAVLHRNSDGAPVWGYVRQDGSIRLGQFEAKGATSPCLDLQLEPPDPNRRPDSTYTPRELFPPELYVRTPSEKLPQLAGRWIFVELGDGSGFGVKVVRTEPVGELTRLILNNSLPLHPWQQGRYYWVNLLGKSYSVRGKARIHIDQPKLIRPPIL